jgi:hypothetical protein
MSQGDLRSAARNALLIDSMIGEDSDLPEWVQGKLTLAADYLNGRSPSTCNTPVPIAM